MNDPRKQHDPDSSRRRSLTKRREEFDGFAEQEAERLRTATDAAIAESNEAITEAKEQIEAAVATAEEKASGSY